MSLKLLALYLYFSLLFLIVLLLYPLFCRVSHCHWNSSSLMLFSTQWQLECRTFLQSVVVSVYQYKHSCSTEMAPPCFNYPSCQLRWKILHLTRRAPILSSCIGLFHTTRCKDALQQTVKWNPEMDVAPNTKLTVQRWVTECLWHLTNGVYSTPTIVPGFLKHQAFAHQWRLDHVWITSRWSG